MKVVSKLLLCLVVTVFFTSCTKETLAEEENVATESMVALEQEMLSLVNQYREENGLAPLEFSEVAYQYASNHNDYMAAQGHLSHDNFSSRASKIAASANAKEVGENVAMEYPTAAEALNGWLNSANHKSTIEKPFTHSAVSVKKGPRGVLYYTQIFYR